MYVSLYAIIFNLASEAIIRKIKEVEGINLVWSKI